MRESAEDYRAIFEATGDGVIIADMEGNPVDVNPALCRMHGYTREEMLRLFPTEFIHPSYHGIFAEYMASLNEGRAYRTTALDVRKDGTAFPVEVNGTVFTYRGQRHVLGVVRDVSDRVHAEARLAEREEQYRRIFESTSDGLIINDPTRGVVVEANPAVCRMHGYTYEEFIGLHATEFIHPDYHPVFADFLETIVAGGSYQCEAVDTRKDGSSFYVEVHGSSVMYQGRPHILAVVRDITERVQARELLEQRVKERTRELSILLDVSRNVTSTLRLKPLLDLILDQLKGVVDYHGAGIFVVEGDEAQIVGFRHPDSAGAPPQGRFHIPERSGALSLRNFLRPTIIDDVRDDSRLALEFREVLGNSLDTYYTFVRSWMAVPMSVKDRVVGYVHLAHGLPGFYTSHHADLALAIAQQAAIAIENARLYEQAQELAALEERQRLARELHDSVTQALYGIGLAAETTRLLLKSDPARAGESNATVQSLARAGMAEMRALLFELRPESLELEGLVAALQKQTAALEARFEVPVETALCGEPPAPLPVKEALYRIAQEALHNAFKHAEPARIEVRLECDAGEVLLEVRDDGKGFDPRGSFPGHLGLHSMRERAARLGGTLEVESAPGEGTCVRARIPSADPP